MRGDRDNRREPCLAAPPPSPPPSRGREFARAGSPSDYLTDVLAGQSGTSCGNHTKGGTQRLVFIIRGVDAIALCRITLLLEGALEKLYNPA